MNNEYVKNAWGNIQSVESAKKELEEALKTKKPVWSAQTGETMSNAKFVEKTQKILKQEKRL